MIISILQIIVAILLIVAVLLQSQGHGLSQAFGGGGEFYRSRRSVEKVLLGATIILSLLFSILSVASLITR